MSTSTPAGGGDFVLYLDYDGVLHHESVVTDHSGAPYIDTGSAGWGQSPYSLFQHAPTLARALEPYPDLKIVLSTSWARIYGFHEAVKFLPEKLRARVIGSTFHSEMSVEAFKQIPRGLQVCQDVERRQPGGWLALDDDAGGWPAWSLDHLVRTDPVAGISAEQVRAYMEETLRTAFQHIDRSRAGSARMAPFRAL